MGIQESAEFAIEMKSILILTHDIDSAVQWVKQQSIENSVVLTEQAVVELNPKKFQFGFLKPDYSDKLVDSMRVMQKSFKFPKNLIMILDMRHQNAVAQIDHDVSILLYDGSLSRRLAYNPTYVTDFVADFNTNVLQELLQKAG